MTLFEMFRNIWLLNGIAAGVFAFAVLCLCVAYVILKPFSDMSKKL